MLKVKSSTEDTVTGKKWNLEVDRDLLDTGHTFLGLHTLS